MIWNTAHPEADIPVMRALAWQQAAELAIIEPERAALLLTRYELAITRVTAERHALELEATRAEALSALWRALPII